MLKTPSYLFTLIITPNSTHTYNVNNNKAYSSAAIQIAPTDWLIIVLFKSRKYIYMCFLI